MVTVSLTDYAEILAADSLLEEYSHESSLAEIGETNPQRGMYAHMEHSGMMRTFGAYSDGALVGFASILLYVLPHYGRKVATVESLFVASSRRSTGAGAKLMHAIEEYAQTQGCAVILYSAPAGGTLEQVLSRRKECRHSNSIFLRKLA